jgi:hypothetical protein
VYLLDVKNCSDPEKLWKSGLILKKFWCKVGDCKLRVFGNLLAKDNRLRKKRSNFGVLKCFDEKERQPTKEEEK